MIGLREFIKHFYLSKKTWTGNNCVFCTTIRKKSMFAVGEVKQIYDITEQGVRRYSALLNYTQGVPVRDDKPNAKGVSVRIKKEDELIPQDLVKINSLGKLSELRSGDYVVFIRNMRPKDIYISQVGNINNKGVYSVEGYKIRQESFVKLSNKGINKVKQYVNFSCNAMECI